MKLRGVNRIGPRVSYQMAQRPERVGHKKSDFWFTDDIKKWYGAKCTKHVKPIF